MGFDKSLPQSVPVSLTRAGYPRIIPRHSRSIIYRHDARANTTVKIYLSFFSFFTIIEKGKKIRRSLFSSICSPIQDIDRVVTWIGEHKHQFKSLLLRYVPAIRSYPLEQGMRWIPSWKVLPTYQSFDQLCKIFPEMYKFRRFKSPFLMQTLELSAFQSLVFFLNARGEQWNQGILFSKRIRYPFDNNNSKFSGTDLDEFESKIGPYLPPWHPAMGPAMTGRLAMKVEGGGKRRIFAIVKSHGYVAGQPLGYRSSWPLFSLTHHLVVWICAEQVYPGRRFDRYALLGDDIVITDKRVAENYEAVLKELQVSISKGKSLISHSGAAEFSKRFFVQNLTVDLSPITLKALLGVHIPVCRYALAHRYPVLSRGSFMDPKGSRLPGKEEGRHRLRSYPAQVTGLASASAEAEAGKTR
ncbi:putative mitochondrial protein [Apostasia shenzhenica]|uniref:Putative mitochondrial protein n=1 Tax=Apostasia shenzhenica TaxID=1088818 RepID=A0A2I0B4L2_9ASPA|nr:putative mitochondrial protein [Apostasia shenzhenica]